MAEAPLLPMPHQRRGLVNRRKDRYQSAKLFYSKVKISVFPVLNYMTMASPLLWLEALAGLKALYDLVEGGIDYAGSLLRHRQETDTLSEAQRVSVAFSTYSDKEIEDLIRRIEGCRDRFIEQGSGRDRARCLCAIFKEISDGNGGKLPRIDDWQRMFDQLACGARRP